MGGLPHSPDGPGRPPPPGGRCLRGGLTRRRPALASGGAWGWSGPGGLLLLDRFRGAGRSGAPAVASNGSARDLPPNLRAVPPPRRGDPGAGRPVRPLGGRCGGAGRGWVGCSCSGAGHGRLGNGRRPQVAAEPWRGRPSGGNRPRWPRPPSRPQSPPSPPPPSPIPLPGTRMERKPLGFPLVPSPARAGWTWRVGGGKLVPDPRPLRG